MDITVDLGIILSINVNKITGSLDQNKLTLDIKDYYHVADVRKHHKSVIYNQLVLQLGGTKDIVDYYPDYNLII